MLSLVHGNLNYVFIGYQKKIICFYNNVMASLNMVRKTNEKFEIRIVDFFSKNRL